ncbi:MAG: AraC family transcriptional regulator [Cyanobacteria bacterium P01_F01_bin.153]
MDLTAREVEEIWAEAEQRCPPQVSGDRLETTYVIQSVLGSGEVREIQLCPDLELSIINVLSTEWTEKTPENEHLVQFAAYLSGEFNSCGYLNDDHLLINSHQGYVGGGGIQPHHQTKVDSLCRQVGVNIHLTPALFRQLFANEYGELPLELHPLVQGDDWQNRFSPKMTETMRTVVRQIVDCQLFGAAKRIYLQGKVFELIALQLDGIAKGDAPSSKTSPRSDTVARLHYAAEILRSRLEDPPCQIELARLVGIGHSTLSKRFREVFGVTPFAYLTRHRMEQAERFLRNPGCTVAEVANLVGYANPAQFAAAFKRHFGITPSECIRGKIVLP